MRLDNIINYNETSHFDNDIIIHEEALAKLKYMKRREEVLQNCKFPVKKCKDGYYYFKAKDINSKNGRRTFKAKSLNELKDKVYEFMEGHPKDGFTFKEIFFKAEQARLDSKKRYAEKYLSAQSTNRRHVSDYKRFFDGEKIENKPISKITMDDIATLVESTIAKKDMKKKSFSNFIAIIREVYNYAVWHGFILQEHNICNQIDFSAYFDNLPDITPASDRYFTDAEIGIILNELKEYHKCKPDYMPAYALELHIMAGLRRGEVPPLMRSDIYYDNENEFMQLYIHKEQIIERIPSDKPNKKYKEKNVIVNHTKTDKNRYIPLNTEMESYIKRLLEVVDTYYPGSMYLFPANNETGTITNNSVYNLLRRILKKHNIPISREFIRGTHSFRRNVTTELLNVSNGNELLVSDIMGNSPEVIRKNYRVKNYDLKGSYDVIAQMSQKLSS